MVVKTLAALGGLDDQDRLVERFVHIDPERIVRAKPNAFSATEPGRELSAVFPLPLGHVDAVEFNRVAILVKEGRELLCCVGEHLEVFERAFRNHPRHVRLAGQDIDLQGLGFLLTECRQGASQ